MFLCLMDYLEVFSRSQFSPRFNLHIEISKFNDLTLKQQKDKGKDLFLRYSTLLVI